MNYMQIEINWTLLIQRYEPHIVMIYPLFCLYFTGFNKGALNLGIIILCNLSLWISFCRI